MFSLTMNLAGWRVVWKSAKGNREVKSVVMGMHEALPDSIANSHSMGRQPDRPPQRRTSLSGSDQIWRRKPQARLCAASHSHFYMENIF